MTQTASRPAGGPPPSVGWNPKTRSLKTRNKLMKRFWKWWEYRQLEAIDGPRDLSDLWAPGRTRGADLPHYYLFNPVHQSSPDGLGPWMEPKAGARLEQILGDFPFGEEENIRKWIKANVVDKGIQPKAIMDVGAGTGATAMVYAEFFPDARIVCIDIAPPLLRWGRKRAAEKGLKNLEWYHVESADMSMFETDSFDVVHEAHTLHEMPAHYIERTVREMVRVCRPGGLLGFFDWALPDNEADWKHRERMVRINQEPFMLEYSKFNFLEYLKTLGCENAERTDRHSNSATYRAYKGPDSNRLLAESPLVAQG
jgi:ubiquinone/menaquinone biosynthesis C-methylase UbiE